MPFDPDPPPPATTAEPAASPPAGRASPRFRLKAATAEAHDRLDALYSRYDLARPRDYGRFLQSHAIAFLPVEAALRDAGANDWIPGWAETMRSDGLRRDLAALSLAVPAPAVSPAFPTAPELLGGLYVLEGSRLGGAMLARTVAAGLPSRFLAPGNAGAWRAFTLLIDARLQSSTDLAAAARSATAVFDLFERSARSFDGADPTCRLSLKPSI